ncbi:hypothetical protein GCM10028791_23810 [Echinicola sediminis]
MTFSLLPDIFDGYNPKRIYKIIFVIFIAALILSKQALSQITGAYRTISSGDFDQVSIWEVYNGITWTSAVAKPSTDNDVYIEYGDEVTLTQNEAIRSLFLNAEAGTGEKLDINDFQLSLYGSLNAYSGPAPGTPNGAWNTIDWIGSSLDSKLAFKGASRVIVPLGAWSAFSTRSRYCVVFDADLGEEFTVQESIKASKFELLSGKVIQEGNPGIDCATFSFNTDPAVSGPYGDFIIENGATLETHCSEDIVLRSASGMIPAALFDLKEGGSLVLNANDPEINAVVVELAGTVTYASNSGNQNFISSAMSEAESPQYYHHLLFEGSGQKNLPDTLYLTGNLTQNGLGSIVDNNTYCSIQGSSDQSIIGFSFEISHLDVDKSNGTVFVDNDLTIDKNFSMIKGGIDFSDQDLFINTSETGAYTYTEGNWSNLKTIHYSNIPATLSSGNASFPFVDKYEGGVRTVQLTGTQNSSGSDLSITYQQVAGVDHDPGYNDKDGEPIMHQLNSYFTFSNLSSDNSNLTLGIAADDLIVDNLDDLRIVAEGTAAEGSHLSAESAGGHYWAKRAITLSEINTNNFTIGSSRQVSVLPVLWLDHGAYQKGSSNWIHWTISDESNILLYRIYRSHTNVDNFELVTEVKAEKKETRTTAGNSYILRDRLNHIDGPVYYQLSGVDNFQNEHHSPVFQLVKKQLIQEKLLISPNPHHQGPIRLSIPSSFDPNRTQLSIRNSQGSIIYEKSGNFSVTHEELQRHLKKLCPGIYLISIQSDESIAYTKWIKQ